MMDINNDKLVQITPEGLEKLKRELDELVNVKRPKLVERLSNARVQGDLTENSDYASARDELEFLDRRIEELEEAIKNAEVVEKRKKGNEVGLGMKVTLKTNSQTHIYHIVGEWEADPLNKKISFTSPLGQALLGKRVGDKVEVDAPAGKVVYEILSID